KRIGHRMRRLAGIAEDMHGEVPDRACNARTIKIESSEIGSPNVFARVHLHAIYDGEKILSPQSVTPSRVVQGARYEMPRLSSVERGDLFAPVRECGELVLYRTVSVGDVVDLTAERVDRVHSVASILRQEPHRPVERGPRRLYTFLDRLAQ